MKPAKKKSTKKKRTKKKLDQTEEGKKNQLSNWLLSEGDPSVLDEVTKQPMKLSDYIKGLSWIILYMMTVADWVKMNITTKNADFFYFLPFQIRKIHSKQLFPSGLVTF